MSYLQYDLFLPPAVLFLTEAAWDPLSVVMINKKMTKLEILFHFVLWI